jgi:hypothetical protein
MDGTVRNTNGHVVGEVGPDGQVWDVAGRGIGRIISSGSVWDEIMRGVGLVSADSYQILDKGGHAIGQIQQDGLVVDIQGNLVGSVSNAPPILTGGAALLLLFRAQ